MVISCPFLSSPSAIVSRSAGSRPATASSMFHHVSIPEDLLWALSNVQYLLGTGHFGWIRFDGTPTCLGNRAGAVDRSAKHG